MERGRPWRPGPRIILERPDERQVGAALAFEVKALQKDGGDEQSQNEIEDGVGLPDQV